MTVTTMEASKGSHYVGQRALENGSSWAPVPWALQMYTTRIDGDASLLPMS